MQRLQLVFSRLPARGQPDRAGVGRVGLLKPSLELVEMPELQRQVSIVGHQPQGFVIVPFGSREIARLLEHVPGLDVDRPEVRLDAKRLVVELRGDGELAAVTRRVGPANQQCDGARRVLRFGDSRGTPPGCCAETRREPLRQLRHVVLPSLEAAFRPRGRVQDGSRWRPASVGTRETASKGLVCCKAREYATRYG